MTSRENQLDPSLVRSVAETVEDVRERGDEAVREATARFDSVEIDSIGVDDAEIRRARRGLSPELVSALDLAADRIERFNRSLLPPGVSTWELDPGIAVGEKFSPLQSAGLWVPCRKGPLASTMLMLGVPAKVAGVEEVIAATPPKEDGSVDAITLAAAARAGVSKVVRGNGVALIAALAFGTESVPKVDAIYGPGPPAVMAALGYVGIYGTRTGPPMGPSECMIVADRDADPSQLAADLLNESEHGPDSSAVLVTDSRGLASRVVELLDRMAEGLPDPRDGYVRESLSAHGMAVVVDGWEQAAELVNSYAPEHLQISLGGEDAESFIRRVTNAGEILVGQATPFSAANYAMGITAVLPTGGSARGHSGITCRDFMKSSTIGKLDKEALPDICHTVEALGGAEGLPAHVEACKRKMSRK
jgi:histidinol dehydrogenase